MSTKDTGGPAFPTSFPLPSGGLSLRDYFAGQAAAGICAQEDSRTFSQTPGGVTLEQWRANIARQDAQYCYRLADAMLAERSK